MSFESSKPKKTAPTQRQSQSPKVGSFNGGCGCPTGLLQNSKSQLSDGFIRWRLEQKWPEIVGKTISDQTLPVALSAVLCTSGFVTPRGCNNFGIFRTRLKKK